MGAQTPQNHGQEMADLDVLEREAQDDVTEEGVLTDTLEGADAMEQVMKAAEGQLYGDTEEGTNAMDAVMTESKAADVARINEIRVELGLPETEASLAPRSVFDVASREMAGSANTGVAESLETPSAEPAEIGNEAAVETALKPVIEKTDRATTDLEQSQEGELKYALGGSVVYDRMPATNPLDTKIILVLNPANGRWTLPEFPVSPDAGDEMAQTKAMIEDLTDIKLDMKEKVDELVEEDQSGNTLEYNYYSAKADSTEPLADEEITRWYTIRDLQEGSVDLYKHVMPVIGKAMEKIIERENQESEK